MKAYTSHFTAAYCWKIPYVENVLGSVARERLEGLRAKRCSGECESQNPETRTGIVVENNEATIDDITVMNPRDRRSFPNHIVHLCTGGFSRDAVVVQNNSFIASPPLVFLELANELDIRRLILLGLQMCSHSPGRFEDAIATQQNLKQFVLRNQWHFGSEKALRALSYIENGSNSIMESLAYMILTLPHQLGGYGLRGAVFNHEITLDATSQSILRQQRCFVDLYYPAISLAVEYDSFSNHRTPEEQSRDMIRATTLERKGIEVVRLGTFQLYDRKACEEFAFNLAGRLGKRIRIRTPKFEEAHRMLRSLLPSAPTI